MMTAVGRRRVILAMSHTVAGVMGVSIVMVLGPRVILPRGALSGLGLAWAATTDRAGCKPNLVPWARTLVAHRTDLAGDDFAVEAAITLALLADHRGQGLPDSERRTLQDAAVRCPSVLHVPCEGARFEGAVTRRCSEGLVGRTPRRSEHRLDAGVNASSRDADLD
jgi:hypothetical protein